MVHYVSVCALDARDILCVEYFAAEYMKQSLKSCVMLSVTELLMFEHLAVKTFLRLCIDVDLGCQL